MDLDIVINGCYRRRWGVDGVGYVGGVRLSVFGVFVILI